MIVWSLDSTHGHRRDGTANDRTAAITDAADAARTAVLSTTDHTDCFTLTIDGDPVLILGLGHRDPDTNAPNIEQALDYIDQMEATEKLGAGLVRAAHPNGPHHTLAGGPNEVGKTTHHHV